SPGKTASRDPYRPLETDEAFLYVNFFGVMDSYLATLAQRFPRFIADLTPAFFCTPPIHTDGFSSARKFFGVPDGGFLFAKDLSRWDECASLPRQRTYDFCRSLLWRTEEPVHTENGYQEFLRQEDAMDSWTPARMSLISERLLRSTDLTAVARRRCANFRRIHERLRDRNTLRFVPDLTGFTSGTSAI
ncbi:MAG: hypothetical protein Q4C47_01665, partial [Planctomycetia bacterium]|nr:hypothetical protein [Planctomycetia bacterium]